MPSFGSYPRSSGTLFEDLAPLADRRRLFAVDVGHSQPPADDQFRQLERFGELGEHVEGPGEALHDEDLRSDVGVNADQIHGVGHPGPGRRLGG